MSPTPAHRDPSSQGRTGTRRRWLVPALIVVVAALLVAAIALFNRNDGESAPSAGTQDPVTGAEDEPQADAPVEVHGAEQPDLRDAETREEDDLQTMGPTDAPVALVVFSDYQCPFCATWSDDTLPVMQEYVDDGALRIEWRDVNVFGEASEQASKAAHAAALQDAYWEYHDELFAGGEHRPAGELSAEALIDLAGDLGLDTDQFRSDMDSEETEAKVQEYAQQGIDMGAFSTPAFIVGGQPIVGAQPTDVFIDAVDDALEAQG